MSHCLRIILQFVLSSNFYLHGSVLLTIYESPYILQIGKGPSQIIQVIQVLGISIKHPTI